MNVLQNPENNQLALVYQKDESSYFLDALIALKYSIIAQHENVIQVLIRRVANWEQLFQCYEVEIQDLLNQHGFDLNQFLDNGYQHQL